MGRHSRQPGRRRSGGFLTLAGLAGSVTAVGVAVVGLTGLMHRTSAPAPTSVEAATVPAVAASTDAIPAPLTPTTAATQSAHPVSLQIPSASVDTSMELLGLAKDGTLQTPTDPRQAGWFTGSSLPGQPGPVVIAGHVDSYSGPAVFAHLKNIKAGDPITITLSGGTRVVYRATSVLAYAKDKFPTQAVYGPRPDSELRLITCGGAFVKGEYVDNIVVFAKLAD